LFLKTENSRRVAESRPVCVGLKGTHTPDAIRQRDAIFRFSLTDNFDPSLNIPNIQKRYNILSYLVYVSFKICSHALVTFKDEKKSRRVVESRPVCRDLERDGKL
jgi:hypothetical protein